jgi:hypothetical protein
MTKISAVMLASLFAGQAFGAGESNIDRDTYVNFVEDAAHATAARYNAKDSAGNRMDSAKIIADANGEFLAVYHTYVNGKPYVNLAKSDDLQNWVWQVRLSDENGGASQPSLLREGNGFVVAWEQEPHNHLKFEFFPDETSLLKATATRVFDAPMVFSKCANGTPTLYSATEENVDFGFHYYSDCQVDREARGTMNWQKFTPTKNPDLDSAVLRWGVQGNIGGRTGFVTYKSQIFQFVEGQFKKGDFSSWRIFVVDKQGKYSAQLKMQTRGGSTAFANPWVATVDFKGKPAVVVSAFIPREGAANGEANELIFYRLLQAK